MLYREIEIAVYDSDKKEEFVTRFYADWGVRDASADLGTRYAHGLVNLCELVKVNSVSVVKKITNLNALIAHLDRNRLVWLNAYEVGRR